MEKKNNFLDPLFSLFKRESNESGLESKRKNDVDEYNAHFSGKRGSFGRAYSVAYDGEKTLGGIGDVVNRVLDYSSLNYRSWDAFLTSEISKTILNKYTTWVIDEGLKLQCNPSTKVLEMNGISLDAEKFNDKVESLFNLWGGSLHSSFSGMTNLNGTSKEGFKNAKVGGDVLVVLRLIDGVPKVELIDGIHVCTPSAPKLAEGNRIVDGIELDSRGKHVAFHVSTSLFESERIEAVNEETGLTVAFLVYGYKYRLNNHRGLPTIASSLETVAKIERYKEAAVGSAEARQNVVFTIEHESFSSGESPLGDSLAKAFDANSSGGSDLPKDVHGEQLANDVFAQTGNESFNMPIGAKMKTLESKNEMFFKEFYETNADIICASVGIPPNVAFSIYNDSFSASRTATKDWEHTMNNERKDYSFQFYQKIYNFWLHVMILQNKIEAPGYLEAIEKKNIYVLEAYRQTRFTGSMFPHIDPLKEVKSERAKLGLTGESIPLTTVEAATEALNAGDSKSNVEQYARELKAAKEKGLIIEDSPSNNLD